MGFEQLAGLKKQLAEEQKEKSLRTTTPAAGPARPTRPSGSKANSGKPAGGKTIDPVVRAIGKMQKRFPAAFPKNPAPKVPLKVGILSDLLTHAEELAMNEALIREALGTWCRGNRYWSCLTDGAVRVDLTGAVAGQVTARDAAFARNEAKRMGSKGRRDHRAPAERDQSDTTAEG